MKFNRKKISTLIGAAFTVSTLLASGSAFAAEKVADNNLGWYVLDGVTVNSSQQLCPGSSSKVCNSGILDQIYAQNNFMPLWQNTALVSAIMPQLQAVADSHTLPGMKARLADLKTLKVIPGQRAYDLLLTDTFLVYVDYINQLKASPQPLYNSKPVKLAPLTLKQAQSYFPLTVAKINALLPDSQDQFTATLGMVNHLLSLPRNPLSMVVFPYHPVQLGQPIPYGKKVAKVLLDLGDLSQADYTTIIAEKSITNTGAMNAAVKSFEANHGLVVDGIIGPNTVKHLVRPYSDVARVLALNLQRERFNPMIKGQPQIVVNIPNFKMELYNKQGQPIFDSKIIDGMPRRPTNLFLTYVNTVVINPFWNVPETIKVQNIIPAQQRNPNFLKNNRIQIFTSWGNRTIIPADKIDWATVNPKTFPHEFSQTPGPENALGRVAFLMPDSFSVYLHDEAQSEYPLFKAHRRDFSSGCMRVDKPRALAKLILGYQTNMTFPPLDDMINSNKHKSIGLSEQVNVNVVYLTSWVNAKGQLEIRPDIYGYDNPRKPIENQFISIPNYRTNTRIHEALLNVSS